MNNTAMDLLPYQKTDRHRRQCFSSDSNFFVQALRNLRADLAKAQHFSLRQKEEVCTADS